MAGICIVLTDGVYATSAMQCRDILYSASLRLGLQSRQHSPAFPIYFASISGDAVTSYNGVILTCDLKIPIVKHEDSIKDHWDLIILSHFFENTNEVHNKEDNLLTWLRQQHGRKTPILALGSSSLWLAQAGLLNGCDATTYWRSFESFQLRHPEVNWCKEKLITQSNNLYCTAGSSALNDVLLDQIVRLCGENVAKGIHRDIMFDMRRAYEFTPLSFSGNKQHNDVLIEQVQQWLEVNYDQIIEFKYVAKQHGMSTRNFARRFFIATKEKPLAYLQRIRIGAARDLLIHSNKSIKAVAIEVGYQDSGYFSQLFQRIEGKSPKQFKLTYCTFHKSFP